MMPPAYDAIVVGSGMSGGLGGQGAHRARAPHAGAGGGAARSTRPPTTPWQCSPGSCRSAARAIGCSRSATRRSSGSATPATSGAGKFFVNDRDNPYTTAGGTSFDWIRGRQVGGRSITWGRQVYRWSDLDFEANLRDGHGVDWPIRYADIAPWYDHVERYIGVSGAAPRDCRRSPTAQFLPGMPLNVAERQVQDRFAEAVCGGSGVLTIGRCAILTQVARRPRGLRLLRRVRARLHHPLLFQQRARDAAGGDSATGQAHPSARTAWCTAWRMIRARAAPRAST